MKEWIIILALTNLLTIFFVVGVTNHSAEMNRIQRNAQNNIYYGVSFDKLPPEIKSHVSELDINSDDMRPHVPESFTSSGEKLFVFSNWTTICYFTAKMVDGDMKIIGTYWQMT